MGVGRGVRGARGQGGGGSGGRGWHRRNCGEGLQRGRKRIANKAGFHSFTVGAEAQLHRAPRIFRFITRDCANASAGVA